MTTHLPSFYFSYILVTLGMLTYNCNTRTQGAEKGGWRVGSQLRWHNEDLFQREGIPNCVWFQSGLGFQLLLWGLRQDLTAYSWLAYYSQKSSCNSQDQICGRHDHTQPMSFRIFFLSEFADCCYFRYQRMHYIVFIKRKLKSSETITQIRLS